jgi:hypothetical protein
MNVCDAMSKKKGCKKIARRTAGGTSATVAIKSQKRPLRTESHISKFEGIAARETRHSRTCFQRTPAKPKAPPPLKRVRSKPMSMVTSNTTSVTSTPIIEGLVTSMLSSAQVFAACDHVDRTYNYQVNLVGQKQPKLKIYPYDTCDTTRFTRHYPMICRKYIPTMRNAKSVSHMPIDIITTTICLSQTAILPSFLKQLVSGG